MAFVSAYHKKEQTSDGGDIIEAPMDEPWMVILYELAVLQIVDLDLDRHIYNYIYILYMHIIYMHIKYIYTYYIILYIYMYKIYILEPYFICWKAPKKDVKLRLSLLIGTFHGQPQ